MSWQKLYFFIYFFNFYLEQKGKRFIKGPLTSGSNSCDIALGWLSAASFYVSNQKWVKKCVINIRLTACSKIFCLTAFFSSCRPNSASFLALCYWPSAWRLLKDSTLALHLVSETGTIQWRLYSRTSGTEVSVTLTSSMLGCPKTWSSTMRSMAGASSLHQAATRWRKTTGEPTAHGLWTILQTATVPLS